MSYWGRLLGGVAGFAMGGPFGAVVGAALGHAAENSALPRMSLADLASPFHPARLLALGRRDHLLTVSVVILAAKLCKCDGAVVRAEIDAFKRHFQIPPDSMREVGRLFDQARDSADDWEPYAEQLGATFADSRPTLERVLAGLFAIARADKPLTPPEAAMLRGIHAAFGLDNLAWDQARGAAAHMESDDDPYAALGMARSASDDELRRAWLRLVRENHPDSLAARGASAEQAAQAGIKVARINAAWDRIKRERGL